MHMHLGALDHEPRHQLRQRALDQRWRRGYAQDALGLGVDAVYDFLRGLGAGQHGLALSVVLLADVGHRETAAGAVHQPHAQPFLQRRHAPAQARLGNVQQPPGLREAAVAHHLHEVIEIIEVFQALLPNGYPPTHPAAASPRRRLPVRVPVPAGTGTLPYAIDA